MDVRGRMHTRVQRESCPVQSFGQHLRRASNRSIVTTAILQTTRPSSPDPRAAYLERLYQNSAVQKVEPPVSVLDPVNRSAALNVVNAVSSTEVVEELRDRTSTSSTPPSGSGHNLGFGNVHVFCYGANMSISSLQQAKVLKVISRDPATVADPSIHMVFKHRGGQATLASLPAGSKPKFRSFDDLVHGVLYQMPRADMKKLQSWQAGYVLRRVMVKTYDGELVEAYAFVSSPMSTLTAEVAPTESYMRTLRKGASDNYLDPAYQAFLSSIETVTSAGLPMDYYDTPSKYAILGLGLACGIAVLLFVLHHQW